MKNKEHVTPKERAEAYAYMLPVILFIIVFICIPVAGTIWTSFFRDVTFMPKQFVWFENYSHLIRDPSFLQSMRFTVLFALIAVPVELLIGLICALVLNEYLPFRGLMRAIVLIPWAIPAAVSARTWELIYNYSYGLANYLMTHLGLSTEPINWLGSSGGAFCALVVADAWKMSPFVAIILMAGLSSIPGEVYRQAQIDGASLIRRFFTITLPLLKPVIIIALLFRSIDSLRIFDIIFVLTGGGPGGSTTSLSHYGYTYFVSGDFGYGAAISVILFIITFTLASVYLRIGYGGRKK